MWKGPKLLIQEIIKGGFLQGAGACFNNTDFLEERDLRKRRVLKNQHEQYPES